MILAALAGLIVGPVLWAVLSAAILMVLVAGAVIASAGHSPMAGNFDFGSEWHGLFAGGLGKKRCQVPLWELRQFPGPPTSVKCRFPTETSDRFRDPLLVAKGHAPGNRSLHFLLLPIGERRGDEINPTRAPGYGPRRQERLFRRGAVRPPPQTAKPPWVWRVAQTRRVSIPLHIPADRQKVIIILDGE